MKLIVTTMMCLAVLKASFALPLPASVGLAHVDALPTPGTAPDPKPKAVKVESFPAQLAESADKQNLKSDPLPGPLPEVPEEKKEEPAAKPEEKKDDLANSEKKLLEQPQPSLEAQPAPEPKLEQPQEEEGLKPAASEIQETVQAAPQEPKQEPAGAPAEQTVSIRSIDL